MPFVAIAGGTSPGLGRSITSACLQSKNWTPIILSRSSNTPSWFSTLSDSNSHPEIRTVIYTSLPSIKSALDGVHTLISVILAKDGTQAHIQIALAQAAVLAGVKRFASSEWAIGSVGIMSVSLLKSMKVQAWAVCEDLVSKHDFEWSRFNVGCFMNYLGIGCGKKIDSKKEDEACAGVDREGDMPDESGAFLVSLGSGTAQLLVNDQGRDVRVTFTEIGDIGRFVAASLDLGDGKWERDMDIAGSTIRLSKVVEICEKVTGKNFEVQTLSRLNLEQQLSEVEENNIMKRLWLDLKKTCTRENDGGGVLEPVVNRLCPEVKPVDVETYITKYWA